MRTAVLDPFQLESSAQRLSGSINIERFESRGGKSNYELAANLRNLLVNRRLAWPAGCGDVVHEGRTHTFADELSEVIVRPMSYGFRIDHDRVKYDDRVISVGQLALTLIKGENEITLSTDGRFF